MTAPLEVDPAIAGLYFPLCAGGRVVLPEGEELSAIQLLAELIERADVTHSTACPLSTLLSSNTSRSRLLASSA